MKALSLFLVALAILSGQQPEPKMDEEVEEGLEKLGDEFIAAVSDLYHPFIISSDRSTVRVATSLGCANDLVKLETAKRSARASGDGVGYRKAIMEMYSLGCLVDLPSGMSITIHAHNPRIVKFSPRHLEHFKLMPGGLTNLAAAFGYVPIEDVANWDHKPYVKAAPKTPARSRQPQGR